MAGRPQFHFLDLCEEEIMSAFKHKKGLAIYVFKDIF